MEAVVKTLNLDGESLAFVLNHHEPWLQWGTQAYGDMPSLLKVCPQLLSPAHVLAYCQVANFIFTGILYEVIEAPDAFKARYEDLFSRVDAFDDEGLPLPPVVGPFDVSEVTLPAVESHRVLFYVEDTYNNVPYRVTAPYPCCSQSEDAVYDLLALAEATA